MTSLRMASHCMTSRCSVLYLLGLCENDCSIEMPNFNKLRFIVYEIFDNSQLFLTDPRRSFFCHIGHGFVKISLILYNSDEKVCEKKCVIL